MTFVFGNEDSLFVQPAVAGTNFETMLKAIRPAFTTFLAEQLEPQQCFPWRTELVTGSGITLLKAHYGASWTYTLQIENETSLVLRFCGTGAVETCVRGEEVTSKPGTAIVTPYAGIGRTNILTDADIDLAASATFIFGDEIVGRCVQDMFGDMILGQLGLVPLLDLETSHGRILVNMCRSLAEGMTGERLLEKSPKAMSLLSEAIVRLILDHAPRRLSDDAIKKSVHVVPRHVKRAIDFMHGNMHRTINLSDIAAASGGSARALQIGFKQFRNTTPLLYLRQIRLEAVRAELSVGGELLSIKEVALKWGFSHMSRFAAQYYQEFGEHPSVTVKRANEK